MTENKKPTGEMTDMIDLARFHDRSVPTPLTRSLIGLMTSPMTDGFDDRGWARREEMRRLGCQSGLRQRWAAAATVTLDGAHWC